MGQKVHPKSFRLKVNKTWDSRWFNDKDFPELLRQDVRIRKFILNKFRNVGVSNVDIERSANQLTVNMHCAKPGLIIGRGGQGAEDLKKEIQNKFLKDGFSRKKGIKNINLNILEIEKPNLDATVVMQQVIADLEKRIPFRRAVKQAMGRVEKAGAQGVKISVAGRLNGAEIARTEMFASGKIPLHTLRADIDYSRAAAQTIYGKIGVKVWIYKGEVFNQETNSNKK
ncbi:MAG TPA: 30S ribosomal protein S3 [bacterium]|nr:30S ribosomal protein S3 [bacterium]HNS34289.1 30S ribosomal protein S3 [bacterium]HNZ73045.1 30S ribosomal protein S3 [bacterium]HOH67141.1 30S ribosomal protein S3 [bacterium]HQA64144.1 30S ribosomal protein S3 [bacterium]